MLTLNPAHFIQSAKDINAYPHFVNLESRNALTRFDKILWVQHAVSGIWWPWLGSNHESWFLEEVDRGINQLSEEHVQYGKAVGLLIDPVETLVQRQLFNNALKMCRAQVAQSGYCKIPRIVFETYYNTVNYWTNQITEELVRDTQVTLRVNRHNSELFQPIHSQLTTLVQLVANEQLKPSYSYMSVYQTGAVLNKHTDRPQCRWNASIMFARNTDYLWPIYVEVGDQSVRIDAELGEVVIYRGTDVPHWRDALPVGTQTACFFHFVQQDYQGSLR